MLQVSPSAMYFNVTAKNSTVTAVQSSIENSLQLLFSTYLHVTSCLFNRQKDVSYESTSNFEKCFFEVLLKRNLVMSIREKETTVIHSKIIYFR